jgi:hypothetical protein
VSRVIQQFQLDIPLRSLFESPTIAAMATLIEAHQENTLDEQEMKLINELSIVGSQAARRRTANKQIANVASLVSMTLSSNVPPVSRIILIHSPPA